MKWCQCYEGQRDETWGCQRPSHTGLSIIHTTSKFCRRRFHWRSRKPLWGRAEEAEEPVYNLSQIHYSHMVSQKQSQSLGGLVYGKKQRTWVQVRGRIVIMGKVGMCKVPCCSQIQVQSHVEQKWNKGFVYYESRKRELKIRLMNEGRSDERLNF